MMTVLIRRIAGVMEAGSLILGALGLLYMVGVVGLNVAARIVFDLTDTGVNLMIPGAIEQVSYILGIVALAGLAASMSQGMILVDFLVARLPELARTLVARFWFAGLVALALVLGWLFTEDMLATYRRGEATQDLRLPMFLIYGLYALQSLALAVVALREALTNQGAQGEIA
ncbi:TRAP transporter small permease [Mesobacterium pallidum]|uniref:TRAP transporter small permease n=1 Tax=Mesobacterium pallidum TaxID=2872037 RepID=UPI001EE38FFF|nr:TRAP transporter small permease subunit [Mesobacterium pallidum]